MNILLAKFFFSGPGGARAPLALYLGPSLLDNWHPEDALLCRFGHWIVLEAANNVNAKVSNILKQGYYFYPTTRIEVVVYL